MADPGASRAASPRCSTPLTSRTTRCRWESGSTFLEIRCCTMPRFRRHGPAGNGSGTRRSTTKAHSTTAAGSEGDVMTAIAVLAPVAAGRTAEPEWIAGFAQHAEACGLESIVVVAHTVVS